MRGLGYALIIVGVWKWIGYFMVLYLAALQDIPRTLYEAADIDGATGVKKLVYITVPLLRNITAFLMVISIINTETDEKKTFESKGDCMKFLNMSSRTFSKFVKGSQVRNCKWTVSMLTV